MADRLYSVDQVAERLGLHVRTVRGYVRAGKLNAVRIGKQYRIAHDDLEEFTGRPVAAPPRATVTGRHVEVSSIVEIDVIDAETASRVSTLLMGATANRGHGDAPLRLETAYDAERARMKIIILGSPIDTAQLLNYVNGVLES